MAAVELHVKSGTLVDALSVANSPFDFLFRNLAVYDLKVSSL
jgi:hypothetical protein